MASNTLEQYAYYVRGRHIGIVQLNQEITNTTVERVSTKTSLWQSPKKTVTDAILFEYITMPKSKDGGEIVDESDEPDVDEYLAFALVDYLKAKYLLDQNEIEVHEYYLRKFREKVGKYESTRIFQERRVMPISTFSIT